MIRRGQPQEIIFLDGEAHLLAAIIASVLQRQTKIKVVLYYALTNRRGLSLTARVFALRVASAAGVNIYYLDPPSEIAPYLSKMRATPVCDPAAETLSPSRRITASGKDTQFELNRTRPLRFLIAGHIDHRKCVVECILALQLLNEEFQGIRPQLSVLGRQTESERARVESAVRGCPGVSVKIIDRFYTDEELGGMLDDCDVVLAVYKAHFGSSALVISAVNHDKAIIFIPVGTLASYAERLQIRNLPLDPNPMEIRNSLRHLLEDHRKGSRVAAQYSQEDREAFLAGRDPDSFARTVLDCE